MNDYIKREDAVFALCFSECGHKPCEGRSICSRAKAMDDIPAADVRENVRGEWLFDDFDGDDVNYQCSHCEQYSRRDSDFCPNCGADMRGEEETT